MLKENVDLLNMNESLPKQMLQVGRAPGLLLELQIFTSVPILWQLSLQSPNIQLPLLEADIQPSLYEGNRGSTYICILKSFQRTSTLNESPYKPHMIVGGG